MIRCRNFTSFLTVLILAFIVALVPVSAYGATDSGAQQPEQEPQTENVESVQKNVDADVADEADVRRKKIMEEAVAAINQTHEALDALKEENTEEALAALERVTGKLELILARDPEMALAPFDVTVTTYDLYAEPDAIRTAIDEAEEFLEDGRVQDARVLLEGLASEAVISVSHIPLASYPDAIKAVAPMIDNGKIEEAKEALRSALNTVVVWDYVVPLPIVRAENLLQEAENLTENSDRTEEQNEQLASLLKDARGQIEMAELLGYGEEETLDTFYRQLDKIETNTKGGKSGEGFFDDIQQTLSKWRRSVFDR